MKKSTGTMNCCLIAIESFAMLAVFAGSLAFALLGVSG